MRRLTLLIAISAAVSLSACGGEPDDISDAFTVETDELFCGDGVCVAGETCLSCTLDCGTCSEAPPMCGVGSCDTDLLSPPEPLGVTEDPSSPDATEPEPSDPTTPDPTEPDPGEPDPYEPDPVDPEPEPEPTEPDPVVDGEWPAEWIAAEEEMLLLVNEARINGATCPSGAKPATHPLTWNLELSIAARLHSEDMANNGYFSHTSQDGRSPWQRIADAGYTANATGENIAAGQSSAQSAFNSWMSSDGHCRNIMSGGSNEIGIGYVAGGAGYGHYWTQTFGAR
jgi:uncharacterized protein YkwD